MPRQISALGLTDARAIIAAGERKAQELGIPYDLAVVDAGGAVIGAVGASGGTVEQDQKVVEAAAAAFSSASR